MKKGILIPGYVWLILAGATRVCFAQPPAISSAREKARRELGQLFVEYSKDSFVKQASEGDTIAVRLFIASGMDPNARIKDGNSALIAAAGSGHAETVQALLAGGADVNAKNMQGGTALLSAAGSGHADVVSLLLNKGADVKAKGPSDSTALMAAAWQENASADIAKALLDKGADINAKDGGEDCADDCGGKRQRKHCENSAGEGR
ncbi:MAG: hypothetical protein DMG08_30020 [Acidobacteria bacterium]|nr:MAG: hypothetical protein DMG08_30020 [Acidobacteriota bacterium]